MEIYEIIITVICLIIFWLLLFCSYTQIRSRDSIFDWWNECPWKSTNKRYKFPLWVILIALVSSFIPYIKIVAIVLALLIYFVQLIGASNNEGNDFEDTRIVVKFKWLDWLGKLLNTRV